MLSPHSGATHWKLQLGDLREERDRLNQKYRLQFVALWNLLGGMEETQGSKALYFKQFGSGRGSAATATVGWHEKDCPTHTERAPLFLICTLILSELQHGQESCWHFSQLSGWIRATWHLSVFVGVCMGDFNSFLHLHRKAKVLFLFHPVRIFSFKAAFKLTEHVMWNICPNVFKKTNPFTNTG